jgi:acetolactate synthase-1/2/3 large subunit
MWAAQYFDFREPRQWLTSGSMGTMGFGLPAAIGAQFARPDALVIDIDGDASIRMNIGEMETCTTYDLPVKVVVLNNLGDGMVKQWQKLYFKGRFAAATRACTARISSRRRRPMVSNTRRLDKKAGRGARGGGVREFQGPCVSRGDDRPDAGVYPMVGPGPGYDDMITGDHIPSRTKVAGSRRPTPRKMFYGRPIRS